MKDLDKFAYDIICGWPKIIGFNPVYCGVDYSQIIRFYLWDKIGRALRIQNGIDFGEVEIYKEEYNAFPFYYTPFISNGSYRNNIFSRKKKIFIPFHVPLTERLVDELKGYKQVRILSKQLTYQLTEKDVIKSSKVKLNENWSQKLFDAILEAFFILNINLISEDKQLLQEQIRGSVLITDTAKKELKKFKPDALYVHSDNHPPYINYVLQAKQLGIPTFTYQHGLDCEHYLLDDCFSDYVAVWTENMKKKYELQSTLKPEKIKVIGNIFINKPSFEKSKYLKKTLLLITRPHRPIKCYSPSRNFLEGKYILEAILGYLKTNTSIILYIKPHPMDFIGIYKKCIIEAGLENRVVISEEKIENLLKQSDVVVTEDSTGGAEALYYNSPCIHAHFADSEPVLPFVEFGCAFRGFNKLELIKNLDTAFTLNPSQLELIKKQQEKFVKEFIPLGNVEDLTNFIIENIK